MLGLHACLLPLPALPGTQNPRPEQGALARAHCVGGHTSMLVAAIDC